MMIWETASITCEEQMLLVTQKFDFDHRRDLTGEVRPLRVYNP